jgi:hypothetical protein
MRSRAAKHALPLATAALAVAVTGFYWVIISTQGDQGDSRPQLVATSLLLAAASMLAAVVVRQRSLRLLLLVFGSSTLLIWTILGALSIGVLLAPAVVLGLLATSRESAALPIVSTWATVAGGAAASLLLAWIVLGSS